MRQKDSNRYAVWITIHRLLDGMGRECEGLGFVDHDSSVWMEWVANVKV